jgi:hypothetical protein
MDVARCAYYVVTVDDKPGELLRFTLKLRDAGVSLSGLWAFGVGGGRADIHAVADDLAALERGLIAGGYQGSRRDCFRLEGEDRIGALCEALDKIESLGLNLRAVDAVGTAGRCAAYFFADPADVERVAKALGC